MKIKENGRGIQLLCVAALKIGHEYSIGIFDQIIREVLEVLVGGQKYLDLF
jgi:hypothetical protein